MTCNDNDLNATVLALSDAEKRRLLSLLVRALSSEEVTTWPNAFPIEDDLGATIGHYLPCQPLMPPLDPEAETELICRINAPGETLSIKEFFTPIRTREAAAPVVGS